MELNVQCFMHKRETNQTNDSVLPSVQKPYCQHSGDEFTKSKYSSSMEPNHSMTLSGKKRKKESTNLYLFCCWGGTLKGITVHLFVPLTSLHGNLSHGKMDMACL